MSAQFAIDPALASGNNNHHDAPTTASPANLTKPPTSPPKTGGNYSILPSYPPLPGWGPFPGPMFTGPSPVAVPVTVPTYIPTSSPHDQWPELHHTQTQPSVPSQPQSQSQKPISAHYQNPSTSSPSTRTKRRTDPPPINPAAALSPHYQNPGGFGGIYTPPAAGDQDPDLGSDGDQPTSHYSHSKSSQGSPLTTLTSSGRQFACGQPGCNAAFDRKSDCERHRRTHVKAAADARPFKCGRPGCEAAFDRKDALMRHERNERTHLVRQTQPGRVKRPSRTTSKSDLDQPRRQSTRKRKSLLPSTADMYASEEDDDYDDDNSDDDQSKRARVDSTEEGLGTGTIPGMEHLVVIPDQLVIDPQLHGLGEGVGVETMQAVEAIQAALQQIEADADAEKHVG